MIIILLIVIILILLGLFVPILIGSAGLFGWIIYMIVEYWWVILLAFIAMGVQGILFPSPEDAEILRLAREESRLAKEEGRPVNTEILRLATEEIRIAKEEGRPVNLVKMREAAEEKEIEQTKAIGPAAKFLTMADSQEKEREKKKERERGER